MPSLEFDLITGNIAQPSWHIELTIKWPPIPRLQSLVLSPFLARLFPKPLNFTAFLGPPYLTLLLYLSCLPGGKNYVLFILCMSTPPEALAYGRISAHLFWIITNLQNLPPFTHKHTFQNLTSKSPYASPRYIVPILMAWFVHVHPSLKVWGHVFYMTLIRVSFKLSLQGYLTVGIY